MIRRASLRLADRDDVVNPPAGKAFAQRSHQRLGLLGIVREVEYDDRFPGEHLHAPWYLELGETARDGLGARPEFFGELLQDRDRGCGVRSLKDAEHRELEAIGAASRSHQQHLVAQSVREPSSSTRTTSAT